MEDAEINVSERDMKTKLAIMQEIHLSVILPKQSVYVFGSQYEGTSLSGKSDVDVVYVNNFPKVVTSISKASSEGCLLLIQDKYTPAGYAKLQLVQDGVPVYGKAYNHMERNKHLVYRSDKENRLVCYFKQPKMSPETERHGPAMTTHVKGVFYFDTLFALGCGSWPTCATEWLTRTRRFNWPPSDVIEICKSLGFILVQKGHPHSDEQHLLWRLSLSRQERLLATNFNSIQLKCYILLKLIKTEVLPRYIREETLTSYHCKTCMFFMIENTLVDFWKEENIADCLIACLRMILQWAKSGVCPNYFITEENMFEGRLSDHHRLKLSEALESILSKDIKLTLKQIKYDNIGKHLSLSSETEKQKVFEDGTGLISTKGYPTLILKHIAVCGLRNVILYREFESNTAELEKNLTSLVYRIRNTLNVTDHTETQTKEAGLTHILAFISPVLLPTIIAHAMSKCYSKEQIWKMLTANRLYMPVLNANLPAKVEVFETNLHYDTFKLRQASIMFMLKYYAASKAVLLSLKRCLRFSICRCVLHKALCPKSKDIGFKIGDKNRLDMALDVHLSKVLAPCVVFLPTQKMLTPVPIIYEMIRCVGTPGGWDPWNLWHDWAVVDGQFLTHFLLYLNHTMLHQQYKALGDILQMETLINEREISHTETCYNLLGWAYKELGWIEEALICFVASLNIQPCHNTAYWHLCFLVSERFNNRNESYYQTRISTRVQ